MTDAISHAKHAQNLMNDPLIDGFFREYKQALFERWLNTPDKDEREEIYQLQIAADAFQIHLNGYIANGYIEMKREEDING